MLVPLPIRFMDNYLRWSFRRSLVYGAIMILLGATIFYFAYFNPVVKNALGFDAYGRTAMLGLFLVGIGAATPFLTLYGDFSKKKKKKRKQKPLPESARLRLIDKHLTKANVRLTANHFEGASDEYHSVAQIYLRSENWADSAKYYWTGAETLAKDSESLSYGVASLYANAAFAYLLTSDLAKSKESEMLARMAYEKLKGRAKERVSFVLKILDSVQNGETKQLRDNWSSVAQKLEGNHGPYAEELVTLVKKNLDVVKN